ncbi:MAG: FHA domain-containing protein [Sorangiineae bacterium]|nr:FHA domain-containing protein [Polyangiaceae bacterium]MEB2321606.1 FHA domain-containing protein [Sorangiineae bacterium]
MRSRPAAPSFDFSPRAAPTRPSGVLCARCRTVNLSGSRFCAECGVPLNPAPAEATAPAPPAPREAQPVHVVGARVVEVTGPPASPEPRVVCARCRGTNVGPMSFCQFCGARLDPATAGAPPAAPAQPHPAASRPAVSVEAPPSTAPAPRSQPPRPSASARQPATVAQYVGAPPVSPARLVVIAQDGTAGNTYELSADQTDIGREEGEILLPNDPYVSPRHARVVRRGSRFFVRDLESVNGIYVRLRRPEPLHHADLVLVGLEVLRFEAVSDTEKGLGPATERGTLVFGSPASPWHARLCRRTVEGTIRDVFYLSEKETVIGRESGNIVFTTDPFMSRRHASISQEGEGKYTLRDLGSSNGTYLAIRAEVEIEPGDHLRIGQHLFRLDLARSGWAPA